LDRVPHPLLNLERLQITVCKSQPTNHCWNDSKLKFTEIPDLEGFKSFFEGFELTPRFSPDSTDASLI
jgi:hypothetical protein